MGVRGGGGVGVGPRDRGSGGKQWGMAQWLERWTHDQKGRGFESPQERWENYFFLILSPRVNVFFFFFFFADSYFGIHSIHARVTAKSRSFCQKCRWQLTAKHIGTIHM